MADYDTIIIGAGNGGLTAALTLARAGLKTLLLEQHNVPGGCGTSFIRGRFEFEIALHQLSGLGSKDNPGPLRWVFDDLGVTDKIDFVEMDNLYRFLMPGDLSVTLQAHKEKMAESLKEKFPSEASNIDKFLDLVWDYSQQWVSVAIMRDPKASKEKYPLFFKYSLKSTQAVFDEFFKDYRLMEAFGVYASYLGLPPVDLPFNNFASVFWLYTHFKPSHMKGGSQAMSNALLDSYLEAGGEVRFNCGAKKIEVADGKVYGVITENGDELSCDRVVSNASELTTYTDMIDPEHVPDKKWKELGSRTVGMSATIAYIGFDCEPTEMDVHETTNFIAASEGGLMDYSKTRTLEPPKGVLFSCYDVDDPDFSPKGSCQAALLAAAYAEPWLNVPASKYYEAKTKYAQSMLELLYKVFPKCKDHIEEIEVATPLTIMRYLGHPGGAIYGFDQFAKDDDLFIERKSPIGGLYQAGSWGGMGGFQPTLQSGYNVGKLIIKSLQ